MHSAFVVMLLHCCYSPRYSYVQVHILGVFYSLDILLLIPFFRFTSVNILDETKVGNDQVQNEKHVIGSLIITQNENKSMNGTYISPNFLSEGILMA